MYFKKIMAILLSLTLIISNSSLIVLAETIASNGNLNTVAEDFCSHNDTNNDNSCDFCEKAMPVNSGSCGSSANYYLYADGTLEIYGEGAIEKEAFYKDATIKKAVIREEITSIGMDAFSYCESLIEIVLPNSLSRIDGCAFWQCVSLKEITLPQNVTVIDSHTFYKCKSLEKVVFLGDITDIRDYAFAHCFALTEIFLSKETTTIGSGAFYECKALSSVTLPESVTSVGSDAFCKCSNLSEITVMNPECTIDDSSNTIPSSAAIICRPNSSAEAYAKKYDREYTIFCLHENIITVERREATCTEDGQTEGKKCEECGNWMLQPEIIPAFSHADENADKICDRCEKEIPVESGTCGTDCKYNLYADGTLEIYGEGEIPSYSFYDDEKIKTVIIKEGITQIGDRAFMGCDNLTRITFPESLTSIASYAFHSCAILDNVVLSESVATIGAYAFGGYIKLNNITILNSECSIDKDAIPYSATRTIIGYKGSTAEENAIENGIRFVEYCPHEKTTSIPAEAAKCDAIAYTAGEKCNSCGRWASGHETLAPLGHLDEDGDCLCDRCKGEMPISSGTCGGYKNEYGYDGSAKYDIYADGTVEIYGEGQVKGGLKGTDGIKKIIVKDGITSIVEESFYGYDRLREVYLPESICEIGMDAFRGCERLKYITIMNAECIIGSKDAKYDRYEYVQNTIPANATIIGKSDSIAREYAGYLEREFLTYCSHEKTTMVQKMEATCNLYGFEAGEKCNDCGRWASGGNLIEKEHYDGDENKQCDYCEVEMPIRSGSCGAFSKYYQYADGTVEIYGEGKIDYEYWAFEGRDDIKAIIIREGITKVDYSVFSSCSNLSVVVMPESMEELKNGAFGYCGALTTVVIPGDCYFYMGYNPFSNCSDDLVIYGDYRSTVQAYAEELNLKFEERVASVSIKTLPKKMTYELKEELDLTGLEFKVTYSDGSMEYLTGPYNIIYDDTRAGTCPVTVYCKGQTVTFDILVTKTLKSISFKPEKRLYKTGAPCDLIGMKLQATYGMNEGVTEDVIITEEMISGFDTTTAGIKKVTISYQDFETSFNIGVTGEENPFAGVMDVKLAVGKDSVEYTGKYIEPEVEVSLGDEILTKDEDYTVTYRNNLSEGTATVMITGIGQYSGTVEKYFTIEKKPTSISYTPDKLIYQVGDECDLVGKTFEAKYVIEGTNRFTVKEFTIEEYMISGFDTSKAGKKVIKISKMGVETEFAIGVTAGGNPFEEYLEVSPLNPNTDCVYSGTPLEPQMKVSIGDFTLTEGVDYSVLDYKNNINAGMATVTVEGFGDYEGKIEATFNITPAPLPEPIWGETSLQYDGTKQIPTFELSGLTKDKDYTVRYSGITVGDGTVEITGIGNYTGSYTKSYTIRIPSGYKVIEDKDDLYYLSSTGNYILMNNISFSASDFQPGERFYNWEATGTASKPFSGTFDGNGYTISGLQVKPYDLSSSAPVYAGLFGYVTGSVKNLHLSNMTVAPSSKYGDIYAGMVAGYVDGGTIENCSASGTFECLASNGDLVVGGIVGAANEGEIKNCRNYTDVIIMGNVSIEIGGIAGKTTGGSITGCMNENKIDGLAKVIDAGGIVGSSTSVISKCYNTGSVLGNCRTGGIVGNFRDGSISACYNIGNISNNKTLGQGLTATVGGIGGTLGAGTSLHDCWNAGSILDTTSGTTYVGGIAGMAASTTTTVADSYNVGLTTKGTNSSSKADAIVGLGGINTVENCYYMNGSVSGENATAVDGSKMMTAEAYKGFDFNNTWEIGDENYLFAYLKGMPVSIEVDDFALPAKMNLTVGATKAIETASGTLPNSGFMIITSEDNVVSRSGDTLKGINVGKVTMEIKSFFGGKSSSCEITVEPFKLTSASISLDKSIWEFTGNPIKPKVAIGSFIEGRDFTVTYSNNVNVGTGIIVVKGMNNCSGTVEMTFTIKACTHSWDAGKIKSNATCITTGEKTLTCTKCKATKSDAIPAKGHTPGSAATCTTPQKCRDCQAQLTPAKGHKPGATATCTTLQKCTDCQAQLAPAKGHTPGATATCTTPQKCTDCQAQLAPAKGHTPGAAATCTATQNCSSCGTELAGKLSHAVATTELGSTATLKKAGSIVEKCACGEIVNTKPIAKIKSVKMAKSSVAYTGKNLKPSVVVKDSAGKTLKNKVDYTVTYKNNKKVGKATVTVKFKGNYSGTKAVTFKINPKVPTIKVPKAVKNTITVKWSKVAKEATGYEVMVATNKKFTQGKKTVTIKNVKTTSTKIKKLKAKKTFYVRVRTYKTVKGVKYYSEWATAKKSVKTK